MAGGNFDQQRHKQTSALEIVPSGRVDNRAGRTRGWKSGDEKAVALVQQRDDGCWGQGEGLWTEGWGRF